MIDGLRFDKLDGLVPAVVQNADTAEVLMVGFMDRAAVEATLRDGLVTFWSRSRQALWRKGETSGHTLSVVEIVPDCDGDTLLILARPSGPTCHTGKRTCFSGGTSPTSAALSELEATIRRRRSSMPEGSYTASLFLAGRGRIAQKVGEEAVETVVAATEGDGSAVTRETADLVYHLTVMLVDQGRSWSDVFGELNRRSGGTKA